MLECPKNLFSVFQSFKFFFEKWLQWDVANVERSKRVPDEAFGLKQL